MITVGLVQSNIKTNEVIANFKHYEEIIKRDLTKPVNLIVFPEMYTTGFSEDMYAEADPMNGRGTEFLIRTAQQFQCDVVASMPVLQEGKLFNRLVWMTQTRILGYYDKHHLFFGEDQFTAGTRKTIVETLGGKFLPLICFDVRFPEWSRNHCVNGRFDYDCLVYVTNFPAPREEMLTKLAVARAIENQSYVLVTNRVGYDGKQRLHNGGTAVIDPSGNILATAEPGQEQMVVADLDFDALAALRKKFPVAQQWE